MYTGQDAWGAEEHSSYHLLSAMYIIAWKLVKATVQVKLHIRKTWVADKRGELFTARNQHSRIKLEKLLKHIKSNLL